MENIEKLAQAGSDPLIEYSSSSAVTTDLPWLDRIIDLLRIKNGFYAFESALHVFPLGKADGVMDLEQWNADDLWRCEYQGAADNLMFFAQDAFGFQFCIGDEGILQFNPEDASTEYIASDIEDWASKMLVDYDGLTGYSLAHDWQSRHRRLENAERLPFTIPLVLGGEVSVDNIAAVNAVEAMRARGYIYRQIRDLPDGATIQLNITD